MHAVSQCAYIQISLAPINIFTYQNRKRIKLKRGGRKKNIETNRNEKSREKII